MIYRVLGKTGLKVGALGLGTEHLNKRSRASVMSVIHHALDNGVNYFDLPFAFPEYRDNLAAAFTGMRNKIVISGHICCAIGRSGSYRISRDVNENSAFFHDLLKRLRTDHVDIVMIQMVNEMISYDNITKTHGIMELARRLKKEGKARFIGVSGHKVPAIRKTIGQGGIDVVMFPINMAWDLVPGRKEIYQICARENVGLVGMKIFGGSRIFLRYDGLRISPVQCISYALAQKGVAAVVPGIKSIRELDGTLRYLDASPKEKSFKQIIGQCQEDMKGQCIYCNHCLPCPQGINIGAVLNHLDRILLKKERLNRMKSAHDFIFPGRIKPGAENFKALSTNAKKCTKCGVCMKRCPFGVDVVSLMTRAMRLKGGP